MWPNFYSRPCGRGDLDRVLVVRVPVDFYSRPCGRGDLKARRRHRSAFSQFLLTPLREGRHLLSFVVVKFLFISTHAPAGGATLGGFSAARILLLFLLTPLREGRPFGMLPSRVRRNYFYSRPCGRGDCHAIWASSSAQLFLLTPLREGRLTIWPHWTLLSSFLLTPLREGRPNTLFCK